MRRFPLLLLAVVAAAGCPNPGCAPCPDKAEVERDWLVTSPCLPDASVVLHVTGLQVNHENDCPSGCYSTATAHVDAVDAGVFVTGDFVSSCGSDLGKLHFETRPSGDAGFSCTLEVSRVGQDVDCGNGCIARLSEP